MAGAPLYGARTPEFERCLQWRVVEIKVSGGYGGAYVPSQAKNGFDSHVRYVCWEREGLLDHESEHDTLLMFG